MAKNTFIYKNPISAEYKDYSVSVERQKTFGTNYSTLMIGGYMEVYRLSDLNFDINPPGHTPGRIVEWTGNTIPIVYYESALSFLPNSIRLNPDNISSGRRKLGMLAYVYETDQIYQYHIPDYEQKFNEASGSTFISDYETIVEDKTPGGQAFIDLWLDSSIEGVNGVTREEARWRKFWGLDWQITGGTIQYNSTGDLNLFSNSGNTITITGLTTIVSGTYFSGESTLTLYNNLGGEVDITGFTDSLVSVSANTGLGIVDQTLYTIYNTTLDNPDLEVPEDVGGFDAGTQLETLTGLTLVEMFDILLFPTIEPTYTIPTISLYGATNSIVEVGSTLEIDLYADGIKNDAGIYTKLRIIRNTLPLLTDTVLDERSVADILPQFGFPDPNNPNSGFTSDIYNESYVIPAPTSSSQPETETFYKADGDYERGLKKLDSKEEIDGRNFQVLQPTAPQEANTEYTSTPYKYTGIYPYFWGLSVNDPTINEIVEDITGGTANKVLISAQNTMTINFGGASEYLWFAHFEWYPEKERYFFDGQNNGDIGGPDNLFRTPITASVDSPEGYWSGINFKIYVTNYQTSTFSPVDLLNS